MERIMTAALFAALLASMARADEPADMLGKAPSRYAKLEKLRVHYKSLGDGKVAVVFIHGFACDMTTWRFQVPAFASKARIILIDLPGHGGSDKPKIDYSMALCARAIDTVLKDAGVEKAVLVGHSMGVPVVRQFWRLYPEKTTAIVAVDGMIAPLAFAASEAQAKALEGPEYKNIMLRFADMTFGKLSPELRRSMKAVIASTPQHVAVGMAKAMTDPAIWMEDSIKVPLQMILSAAPIWPSDYEKQVRKLAPQLEFHRMKDVGHCLMLEKPEAFNAHLGQFLKRQGLLKPWAVRPARATPARPPSRLQPRLCGAEAGTHASQQCACARPVARGVAGGYTGLPDGIPAMRQRQMQIRSASEGHASLRSAWYPGENPHGAR
jgi:pimeloyl-ACP methyl ester carboxylesterase